MPRVAKEEKNLLDSYEKGKMEISQEFENRSQSLSENCPSNLFLLPKGPTFMTTQPTKGNHLFQLDSSLILLYCKA